LLVADMKKSWPIICILAAIFIDILCGALATNLLYNCRLESILGVRTQTREDVIVSRLAGKLDLDDRQEEQVRTIIHQTEGEIESAHSQIHPKLEVIVEKAQVKIRAILTPEQIKKYEQMIAAHKEKLGKRGA